MARESSSTIAFIGCGVQAQSHLNAFTDLFSLKKAHLFGRGKPNIDRLTKSAQKYGLEVSVFNRVEEAVQEADIVISSITYSSTLAPFINANCLKVGSFAAITDLAVPWIKNSFASLDHIVIDDLEQEASAHNKLLPTGYIDGDLSKLVLGNIQGRNTAKERNAFVFRGHAMGDLALSILAYQAYQQHLV
jgi:ornithine cyclodeaminase/alanine dehydrogenase